MKNQILLASVIIVAASFILGNTRTFSETLIQALGFVTAGAVGGLLVGYVALGARNIRAVAMCLLVLAGFLLVSSPVFAPMAAGTYLVAAGLLIGSALMSG